MKKENKPVEEKENISQMDNLKKRRDFLKKVVYNTPTIFVLGGLLKPTDIHADGSGGPPPPPPPPDWGNAW